MIDPALAPLAAVAATAVLLAVLGAIAVIDLRTYRIPDRLSLPLMAAGLLAGPFLRGTPPTDHVTGAAVAFALFAAVGEWHFRRRGVEGLGLGDAKLFAAGGAWLGWQDLAPVLLVAALGGLAFALAVGRGRPLAFGPWLALGIAALWLWPMLRQAWPGGG